MTNDELIDQVVRYHREASGRLSECAEELEITKGQIIAITEVIQSLMTKYDFSASETSQLVFLITSVMGWKTDIQNRKRQFV